MDTETIVTMAGSAVWFVGAAVAYGIFSHVDRKDDDIDIRLLASSLWPVILLAIAFIGPLILIVLYILIPMARPFVFVGGLIGRAIEPLMNWMEKR